MFSPLVTSSLCGLLIFSFASRLAAAERVGLQEKERASPFWRQEFFTGEWGGGRTQLASWGIVPQASYLAGVWGVPVGGLEQAVRYEGFFQWSLLLDFERMFGARGLLFAINGYSYHGGLPSELVGVFPARTVSGNEAALSLRVFEVLLRVTLLEERLTFELGQLAADDDFFVAEGATHFANGTWGFFGFGRELQVAPMYPFAAPGGYVEWASPNDAFETRLGVYSASVGEDEAGNRGFDSDFKNGLFAISEFQVSWELAGAKGRYALGAMATNARLPDFGSDEESRGNFGGYVSVEHDLLQPTETRPGLETFFRVYTSFPPHHVFIPAYWDIGVAVHRPLWDRADDVLAVGISQARFSDAYLLDQRRMGVFARAWETIFECTYAVQLTPFFALQPDVQVVFAPHFARATALVLGLGTTIEL